MLYKLPLGDGTNLIHFITAIFLKFCSRPNWSACQTSSLAALLFFFINANSSFASESSLDITNQNQVKTIDKNSLELFSDRRALQRKKFLVNNKIVWKLTNQQVYKLAEELEDYPLVPYLIEKKISDKISIYDKKRVSDFLQTYEHSPLAKKLRRNWLRYLARRQSKNLFIEFYQPTSDVKLNCTYLKYKLDKGASIDEFKDEVRELWTVGVSQPKQCDSIFNQWIKAGFLNQDIALQRIAKAADGGNHTLIPYLKRFLKDDAIYLADMWHKVRRNPSYLTNSNKFLGRYPKTEAQIITYGLKRLVWRNVNRALSVLDKVESKNKLNQQQRIEIYNRFAIKLAIDEHNRSLEFLQKAFELNQDAEVMRWYLAYFLKKQNWTDLIEFVSLLPQELKIENEYQYWLARALEQTNKSEQAETIYTKLANQRHYYGFLASARLGIPYQLHHHPVTVNYDNIKAVFEQESAERALELRQIGWMNEARVEWRAMQRNLEDQHKLAAASIANALGWHDETILTLSRNGHLDDISKRFPSAFKEKIVSESEKNNIAPEWAFAITRRESAFMTDAISSANARGLMQLLPSTAKYLEKRKISSRQLLDANLNIKIGSKYLRYLMNKVNENSVLATASYNAGWRRVRAWLPDGGSIEADLWVETIPFKETRNYVKAVLAYQQIYQGKLQDENLSKPNDGRVFAELIALKIPESI